MMSRALCLAVTAALSALLLPAAFADEFVLAGNLLEPRRAHCATLLQDGRVFVAGGSGLSADNPLNSAEIYDPLTEASQVAGTMNLARGRDPVCVALDDGNRVLVMGGATARFTYTNTAEVYDLTTGLFSMVGNMTAVRTAFTAFKRADGRVLAFGGIREGGFGTATPNVDLFDPVTETFSLVATLIGARHDHSSQVLPSGEILLVGGSRRFNLFADPVAEVYDPQTNSSRLTTGPVLFEPRGRSIESVRMGDGRVLIASGNGLPAEIYDPATDAFSVVPGTPLFEADPFGHSAHLDDGRALLLGFGRAPSEQGRHAEIFDPVTEEFTGVAFATASVCAAFRAQLIADGSVIVTGGGKLVGGSCEPSTETVERFVPSLMELMIAIDIKPGSDLNNVNPRSGGVIPVVILTTSTADGEALDFDAETVDVDSLAFGPGGATIAHVQGHADDVEGDGDLDLVVHFRVRDSGIACGDTEALLTGQTVQGQIIVATDSIKTTGCS